MRQSIIIIVLLILFTMHIQMQNLSYQFISELDYNI